LLGLNKDEERNLIVAEAGRRKTEGVFKQAAARHEFCKEQIFRKSPSFLLITSRNRVKREPHFVVFHILELYSKSTLKNVYFSRSPRIFRIKGHKNILDPYVLGLLNPDPLLRDMDLDPAPDPSIIMQK
jgi:hypothetical protein